MVILMFRKEFLIFFIILQDMALSDELDKSKKEIQESNLKDIDLGKIKSSTEAFKYQEGNKVTQTILENSPTGNGDITSILKILPNVQFDNAQLKSSKPGEIDPANISISGGLYYQNNFMLDGFNMNNDLDPANSQGRNPVSTNALPGRSQGLNIDTSLLETIIVQDSNIGAQYSGFTGGVVEAITKKPNKKFGANISYQITQGNAKKNAFSLTQYYIDDNNLNNFINTDSPTGGQPSFMKHIFRAAIESKFSNNAGVIAQFNTNQSLIPVNAYANSFVNKSNVLDSNKKTMKRQNYNAFIKGFYDIDESIRLEVSYTYSPQFNEYFIRNTKNSNFYMQSGGHSGGFKSIFNHSLGILEFQVGASYLSSSRSGSASDMRIWRYSSDKNWNPNGTNNEGGYGNVDTNQADFNAKIIQEFVEIDLEGLINSITLGLEGGYTNAKWERKQDSYFTFAPSGSALSKDSGFVCSETYWCSDGDFTYNSQMYYGQWAQQAFFYKSGKIFINNLAFGAFAQDDIKVNLSNAGIFSVRLGLRLDYDNYMKNHNFAPRLSLKYEMPWNRINNSTSIIFGINKYYGRNLYTYALLDGRNALNSMLKRNKETDSWNDAKVTQYKNNTTFSSLKTPHSLEVTGGLEQKISYFTIVTKYIKRMGIDEIRRGCYNANGTFKGGSCGVDGVSATNNRGDHYRYTNSGVSNTDIVSLSISNAKSLGNDLSNNFFLLAFDWTDIKRNYDDYASNLSTDEANGSDLISYNGKLISSSNIPASNFNRPWTLRLSTTHLINLYKTRLIFNNFFRYRSSYFAMTAITSGNTRDQFDINGDGVLEYVTTYRPTKLNGIFSFDVRTGIEIDVYDKNILYFNIDIINVLNSKNQIVGSYSSSRGATTPVLDYEIGRQFWLQIGYKI